MITRSPNIKALHACAVETAVAALKNVIETEPGEIPHLHDALRLLIQARETGGMEEIRQAQAILKTLLERDTRSAREPSAPERFVTVAPYRTKSTNGD